MLIALTLVPIFAAVAVCIVARHRGLIEYTSVAAVVAAFVGSVAVAVKVAAAGTYAPYQFFSIDALGAIVVLTVATVGLATTVYSVAYLREETAKHIIGFTKVRQYFILLNLFLAAMFLAASSSNPIVTWISIEATTLSTAFLISFYNKASSVEAAWKYLIVNSIGLLLGFFGTLLYLTSLHASGGAGLTTWATWSTLLSSAVHLNPMVAKIAFAFVLVGYGTKVGLAPMHTWKPDAYSKAPAPIGALFSGALLPVAFVTLMRFRAVTDSVVGASFSKDLLITFGVLSIAVASFIVFSARNYKRLLAYSSIEHAGIMALGFGFGGLGTFAAILDMVYHSLIKSALFSSSGNLLLKYNSAKIANVRGALAAVPVTGVLFLVGFFAITGAPPFGIFLTELLVLSAGMKVHPAVTVVVVFLMALLFVGFFRHVTAMVFGEKPADVKSGEGSIWLVIPPLALILVALYLSFHIPSFLSTLLTAAVARY